jgi:hypothetical protein
VRLDVPDHRQPFEAVWGLATLGMIANVLAWLAIGRRPAAAYSP